MNSPMPPPPAVAHIIDSYPKYMAAINQAQVAVQTLQSEAISLMGCPVYSTPWRWDAFARQSERDLALLAIDDLIDESLKALSYNGFCPEMDSYTRREFIEKHDILSCLDSPDLIKVWALLSEMFGGDRGKATVNRRIAKSIRSDLNLYPDHYTSHHVRRFHPRPQIEKDGVLFHMSTTIETSHIGVAGHQLDVRGYYTVHDLDERLSQCTEGGVLGNLLPALRVQMNKPLKLPFRVTANGARISFFTSKTTLWLSMNKAMDIKAFVDEWDPLHEPLNQEAAA